MTRIFRLTATNVAGAMVGFDETAVEVAHRGGTADGGARGVEKGAAHERSSMTGFGWPCSFSAFVCMRGEADKGGDLLSGQAAKLRQVGDQRGGHDRTDAAHRAQGLGEAIEPPSLAM
jgi:hypothetical protein